MVKFSLETAKMLVEFSIQAYNDPEEINIQPLGYELVEFINNQKSDTQCLVAKNQNSAVFAFRGTSSVKDALVDLSISKISFPKYGFFKRLFKIRSLVKSKAHAGFLDSFKSVESDIQLATIKLQAEGIKRFYVTGHSLGGAVATITALYLKTSLHIDPTVYTYGSPKTGNKQFAKYFNRQVKNSFRVVNDDDPIPSVPGSTFKHVKNEALLDENHTIIINPGFIEKFEKGIESIISILTVNILENHSSHTYKKLLDENKSIQ